MDTRDIRCSFPLFSDEKQKMDKTCLVRDRLQSQVFRSLALELTDVLNEMDAPQQRIFLYAIIDRKLSLKEWHPAIKKLMEKETKDAT